MRVATVRNSLKLAILIPAYNSAATIGDTITSLQRVESGWQQVDRVLVCDDCSSDDTIQVAESIFFDRCQLTVLKHDKNGGEATCYQSMITALPPGVDWFLILHADDLALPCFLTRNIEIIEKSDDAVAAVSSNYYVFGSGSERLGHSPAADLIIFRSNAPDEVNHTATIGCWWHISGSLVSRKLWEEFGGRHPELPMLGDWELILRWQTAGYRVGHSLIPTTKSRIHSGSVSSRSYREFRDIEERVKIISDNPTVFTPKVKMKWIVQIVGTSIRRILKFAIRGRVTDAARGLSITLGCLLSLIRTTVSPRELPEGASDRG